VPFHCSMKDISKSREGRPLKARRRVGASLSGVAVWIRMRADRLSAEKPLQ